MYNDVEIIDENTTDLAVTESNNQKGNELFDTNFENLKYMAKRADEYVAYVKRIMNAALAVTNEKDWVLIGGVPYLQESGADSVAALYGITWENIVPPKKDVDDDGYVTWTYNMRFTMASRTIECDGSRSARQDFFSGKGKKKSPDEIIERDVQRSAYTNCVNNGIKRIIPGLRNIDIDTLAKAGLDVNKIKGYTFKDGSKGGASKNAEDSGFVCTDCGAAITHTVASYSQGKFGRHLCMNCQKKVGTNEEA